MDNSSNFLWSSVQFPSAGSQFRAVAGNEEKRERNKDELEREGREQEPEHVGLQPTFFSGTDEEGKILHQQIGERPQGCNSVK